MTQYHFEDVRTLPSSLFDVAPSCLGFGCASLGSRVGAREGLAALAAAYDAGITWYDVAPPYGAGEAEALLGRFLASRRDKVIVTTKVGLAPPKALPLVRLVYTLGRPAIGALGGLRRAFRKVSATRNRPLALDGALVARSLETSLRHLGTDRVDVLALHDPAPEDVERDDVLRALEAAVASGKARTVAVAGRRAACEAASRVGAPFGVLQTDTETIASTGFASETFKVVHSVFGVGGMRDRVIGALSVSETARRRIVAAGYASDPRQAASDLLLDRAFALNPDGVVLASMFGPGHLARNIARAGCLRPEAPALLRDIVAGAKG